MKKLSGESVTLLMREVSKLESRVGSLMVAKVEHQKQVVKLDAELDAELDRLAAAINSINSDIYGVPSCP